MDRGAWRAIVHGVTKNWARLKSLITHTHPPRPLSGAPGSGGAGGAKDGFPGPGDESGVQHHRFQSQRRCPDQHRSALQGGDRKAAGTDTKYRIKEGYLMKEQRNGLLLVISGPSGVGN